MTVTRSPLTTSKGVRDDCEDTLRSCAAALEDEQGEFGSDAVDNAVSALRAAAGAISALRIDLMYERTFNKFRDPEVIPSV